MNKNIVIIGGSTGIGKAIVERAALDTGNKISVFSRQEELMASNFKSLDNVSVHFLDLEKIDANEFKENISTLNNIDILINNAGYLVKKDFEKLSHQDIIKSYQINVIGIMQIVQATIPFMTNKGGHIVNISSMGGFQGSMKFPGLSAYST